MNKKQVADSLNIGITSVGRYTKKLSKYHPNFIQIIKEKRVYDEKAYKAIKYMRVLVSKGLTIEDAVVPVLREIYDIDVVNFGVTQCQCCANLQKQLVFNNALIKQQQETINLLTKNLVGQ